MGLKIDCLNGHRHEVGKHNLLRRSILAVHDQSTTAIDFDPSGVGNAKTSVLAAYIGERN